MCDGIIRGVARFNPAGEVLWRKSYALLDKELTLESSWGFCQHYSGQRQLHAPLNIALLPDGSFAINFYNQLVRVNGDTGLPLKVVPRLSVIDSADVVAFTNAAYSRLNSNKNRWGVDVLPNSNVEATYYRLQQYFFFPQD